MKLLLAILTTSRGWLIRQVLKGASYVLIPFYTWLELNGHASEVTTIAVGITSLITALCEIGLSYLARKNN